MFILILRVLHIYIAGAHQAMTRFSRQDLQPPVLLAGFILRRQEQTPHNGNLRIGSKRSWGPAYKTADRLQIHFQLVGNIASNMPFNGARIGSMTTIGLYDDKVWHGKSGGYEKKSRFFLPKFESGWNNGMI
jgi:hypothetical protein